VVTPEEHELEPTPGRGTTPMQRRRVPDPGCLPQQPLQRSRDRRPRPQRHGSA
jgi:hypothetical protein